MQTSTKRCKAQENFQLLSRPGNTATSAKWRNHALNLCHANMTAKRRKTCNWCLVREALQLVPSVKNAAVLLLIWFKMNPKFITENDAYLLKPIIEFSKCRAERNSYFSTFSQTTPSLSGKVKVFLSKQNYHQQDLS